MRSLVLPLLLCVFFVVQSAHAQPRIDLFVVEKPIENYQSSQLNALLEDAMRDLLVRVVGGESALQTEEADKYIQRSRQWVKSFQFQNREADGVVIGQNLVVEFDRDRLLAEFQQDAIHIWPLSNRPKTLLLGQWEQQGLVVNLSEQSLQYRVDLDYRDYARLLALPITLPQTPAEFDHVNPTRVLWTDTLDDSLRQAWQLSGADYALVFKSDTIGEVVSLVWGVYSLQTGERILHSDETGEGFLELVHGSFDSLLELYSAPYRQGLSSLGLLQLEVAEIPSYQALMELERFMQRLRPTFNDVKLSKVQAEQATFDIVYQGHYVDVLRLLERVPHLQLLEESIFGSELRGRYQP